MRFIDYDFVNLGVLWIFVCEFIGLLKVKVLDIFFLVFDFPLFMTSSIRNRNLIPPL